MLDAQLAESVAALEAYQNHLDTWHQDLVREREELRQLRESVERDQTGGGVDEVVERLKKELEVARAKISTLTSDLQIRTEELRESDRQRENAISELNQLCKPGKEPAAALAAQRQPDGVLRCAEVNQSNLPQTDTNAVRESETDAKHEEHVNNDDATDAKDKEPSWIASPVLGSVMEQFGKLRMQRSMRSKNRLQANYGSET